MDADDILRIRSTVEDRMVAYWRDVDRFDAGDATDYYTSDCVYLMLGHRLEGPDGVRSYYDFKASRGVRIVRHIMTNVHIEVGDARSARLEAVLSVYAADAAPVLPAAAPLMIADAEVEFVREDDGAWRMRLHRLTPVFGGQEILTPPAR